MFKFRRAATGVDLSLGGGCFNRRARPSVADFNHLLSKFVDGLVADDTKIVSLFELFAKRENFRVRFIRRILDGLHQVAHRHRRVIAALYGEQKELSEQIARPPVVLKNLDEVGAPAHIV